jgi:DNA-binding transcriptional LysR family regulator
MSLGGTDLNLLNALKVLLEEANVTHAGQRLNMRQPAMSGALARLRRQFGDELLVRSGRDFELTPLGLELLPSVQRAQRLLNEALMIGEQFEPATSTRVFRFALSDYALSVMYQPIMRRIVAQAPHTTIEFDPICADARGTNRDLIDHDLLIGPMGGYGFPGRGEPLFEDRMVCLVDRHNSRLRDGRLSLDDLSKLPFAVATFGRNHPTPADRILGEIGLTPHVQALVTGWLAVPFTVEHTDMVAVVPGRLAGQFCTDNTDLVMVEPPFGEFPLIEGYWCQEAKLAEPAQQWLISVVRDAAEDLADGQTGGGTKRPRSMSLKLSLATSSLIGSAVPQRS